MGTCTNAGYTEDVATVDLMRDYLKYWPAGKPKPEKLSSMWNGEPLENAVNWINFEQSLTKHSTQRVFILRSNRK